MRSSWKTIVVVAAGICLAPQFAAAEDVQSQLDQMEQRMMEMEQRLQATSDQLKMRMPG